MTQMALSPGAARLIWDSCKAGTASCAAAGRPRARLKRSAAIRIGGLSRFGRAKWLEHYTDAVLKELPGRGVSKVTVVAPGFAADCLETLEELAIRGRDAFLAAGGERFGYLPCLNDGEAGIAMLRSLISRELEGWVQAQ